MTKRSSQRIVIDVRLELGWWVARVGPGELDPSLRSFTKPPAIRLAAGQARALMEFGGLSQVRIFKRNGQIQSERTYGADPRRSKG